MTGTLHLTIATPETTVVNDSGVHSVRASDESGSFGILAGHADVLTVLPASVVRWRDAQGAEHFCAVRGGVLSLAGGDRLSIACRSAQLGERLDALEAEILSARAAEDEEDRKARVAQARLHARAIRQLMRSLTPAGSALDAGDILPETLR